MDYQLEIILPLGTQPDWYSYLSPLGRIPALKNDDFTLADSSVICQYLDEKYPQASLFGQNPKQRAQVRWLEKSADYELAPPSSFTVLRNRALKPSMGQRYGEAAVQKALHEHLPAHFDCLEKTLRGLQGTIKHGFQHPLITFAGLERQVIAEQHKALRQPLQCQPDDHVRFRSSAAPPLHARPSALAPAMIYQCCVRPRATHG